ncbi:MAG: hypothetical protein QM704_14280 [Anaeromyxobacteraceae bacterium]
MKDGDGCHGGREVAAASAVVAQDAPVFEASEDVFDASPAATMAAPGAIPNDPVAPVDRDAKAGDASVSTVGEHTAVVEAKRFDFGAAEMKRVVSVARPAGRRGHDATVSPAHEHLGVAGPAVVLGFRSAAVITSGDEGPIDDPGLAAISPDGRASEASEPRREGCDDAMDGRLREADDGGELAQGEVGAQRYAGDEEAVQRRARAGTPPAPGRGEHAPEASEVAP